MNSVAIKAQIRAKLDKQNPQFQTLVRLTAGSAA